jgi:hypothetical protein
MFRRARRAAASEVRKAQLDPITAIHEAGHAVARYLTAADMGWVTDKSVAYS